MTITFAPLLVHFWSLAGAGASWKASTGSWADLPPYCWMPLDSQQLFLWSFSTCVCSHLSLTSICVVWWCCAGSWSSMVSNPQKVYRFLDGGCAYPQGISQSPNPLRSWKNKTFCSPQFGTLQSWPLLLSFNTHVFIGVPEENCSGKKRLSLFNLLFPNLFYLKTQHHKHTAPIPHRGPLTSDMLS